MKSAPVVLLLLVALAGCGGTPPEPVPTGAAPTTASDAPEDHSPPCTRDDLDIAFSETDGSAGQRHGVLALTNSAPSACFVDGYPILYLGNSEVEQPQGPPAEEDPTTAPVPVVLEPGAVATSDVTITQAGNVEGCTVATTTHLIAAPPQTEAFVWEDDGRDVPTPELDGCLEDDIGLLSVTPLVLAAS